MAIPLLRQAASIAIAAGLSHANPAAAAPSATPAPSATNATAVAPVAKGRLELHRTSRQLASSGDPIWELHLQLPRGERHVFEALVGRAHRQGGLASEAVAIAPLPPGRYHLEALTALDRQADHTLPAELGNLYWIGLEPQFRTDRRALGIHHDPSAGQKLESGTDGCIGLIRASDLLALGVLLQQHRPSELVVLH